MKIKMAGIDYIKATLSQREVFAFSKTQAQSAMQIVIKTYGVQGCVIISTCNRTEIWIYENDDNRTDLEKVLCTLKEVALEDHKQFLITREGIEAVQHLFETACGLKSQIWGEDQILAQIKLAVAAARNAGTTNEVLEKLFQTAITSAKKIKSTVRLTACDVSIGTRTLDLIEEHFPCLKDLRCLVLGNGVIGRMISSKLAEAGAQVTVTLREHKHRMSLVPEECIAVNYEQRIAEIIKADIIISATSSPHHTIKAEDVCDILADRKYRVFIDLAVPRDIDPQISEYKNVILHDIESLGGVTRTKESNRALLKAKQIIDDYMICFLKWQTIRHILPYINGTKSNSSTELISCKLRHEVKRLSLETQMGSLLEKKVLSVTLKAICEILYKTQDRMDKEFAEEC